jgi:hypothetical protein
MRQALFFQGKVEPITPREARLASSVIRAVRLAKRPAEDVRADEIDAQMTRCMIALFASKLAAAERRRKPRVKRFRIPLRLP